MKVVRIGNGCGFWGDSPDAPRRLVEATRLDYLTLEYLAELTMSILALQKQKHPQAGYARDFLAVLDSLGPFLADQPQLKIITNAGGMNPKTCAEEAQKVLEERGLHDRKLAVVAGDDLMEDLDRLYAEGHHFNNLETGAPLEAIIGKIVSANAYLGAGPMVDALRQDASIIITGRVADASLTVAPALHEFGHTVDSNPELLAAATVAGHLIECGAQVTGGLWCHADASTHLEHVGYPVAEMRADGQVTITKPERSGGVVNRETVIEQLLYEVADPSRYYTPDIIADFTQVTVTESGPDRVEVTGAQGALAPDSYKVSIAYRDGYSAAGTLVIAGPDAVGKAKLSGKILLDRLAREGITFDRQHIEVLGSGSTVPGVISAASSPPEVVLRVAVHDQRRSAVERFTREFAPLVTSGLPGTTGYTTGRAAVREVFAYWPALVAKSVVRPRVTLL